MTINQNLDLLFSLKEEILCKMKKEIIVNKLKKLKKELGGRTDVEPRFQYDILDFVGENTKDLFEDVENLPQQVQDIIEKYDEMDLDYNSCRNLVNDLNKVGYTCEYGLDAMPINLRKM